MTHLNRVFRTLFTASVAIMIIIGCDSCDDDDGMGGDPNPTTTTGTASGTATATDTDTGGGTPGTDTDTDSGMDTDSDSGMGSDADGGMGSDPVFISCFDGGQMGTVGEPGIDYSDRTEDTVIPIQLTNSWDYDNAAGAGSLNVSCDEEMFIDNPDAGITWQFIRFMDSWFHIKGNDYYEAIDIGGGEFAIVRVYRQNLNQGQSIDISDPANGITGTGSQANTGFPCFQSLAVGGQDCSRYNVEVSVNGTTHRDQIWFIVPGIGIVGYQEGGADYQITDFEVTAEAPLLDADPTPSDAGPIPFANGNSWTYSSSVGDDFTITLGPDSDLFLFNQQFYWFFNRWIFSQQGEYVEVIDVDGDCALRTILDLNLADEDVVESPIVTLANGDNIQVRSERSISGIGTTINGMAFTDSVIFTVEYLTNGEVSNTELWWVVDGIGVVQYRSENPELEYGILEWDVN